MSDNTPSIGIIDPLQLEVIKQGTFKATWSFSIHNGVVNAGSESQTLTTINHNLGYIPIPLIFRGNATIYEPVCKGSVYLNVFQTNAWQSLTYGVDVTSTTLTVYLNNDYSAASGGSTQGNSATNEPYVYYLLRQRGSQ